MRFSFLLVMASMILINSHAFSQEKKYLGSEKDITLDELLVKSGQTDFGNKSAAAIFSDSKNSYYAIDNGKIESKYVKIRILEESYKDKTLVNIGPAIDEGYMVFLVNNTLNKSDLDILKLLDDYRLKAQDEESLMSEGAKPIWFANRKKFNKK